MTRRGWVIVVLVAWGTSLGWLVKRVFFLTTAARLAEAARSIAPGTVYYRLVVGGQQVGFASFTIDTSGSAIRVEDLLILDVPALGVLHRTTARSRATLSRALRLEEVDVKFDGDIGRFTARGVVNGDTLLSVQLMSGRDTQVTLVPLTRPVVLPTLLPLRLAFGGELRPGKTYTSRVFDPLLLVERELTLTGAAESTLVVADSADYDSTVMAWVPVRFDTVRAFRIDMKAGAGGMRGSTWVDAQGHIVRTTNPVGFTIERSAFEIAYENFRRRDKVRVARASASPGPGDVVAAEQHAAVGRAEDARDHPQRGGLAGPVRSEEPVEDAPRHVEGDVVHGGEATVALGEVLQPDHSASSLSRPIRRTSSACRARPPVEKRRCAASAGN